MPLFNLIQSKVFKQTYPSLCLYKLIKPIKGIKARKLAFKLKIKLRSDIDVFVWLEGKKKLRKVEEIEFRQYVVKLMFKLCTLSQSQYEWGRHMAVAWHVKDVGRMGYVIVGRKTALQVPIPMLAGLWGSKIEAHLATWLIYSTWGASDFILVSCFPTCHVDPTQACIYFSFQSQNTL